MTRADLEEGITPETLVQLKALPIQQGRPLIAVDADEVLVVFVDHLDRYIRTLGYEMRLVTYQLEGTMFPIGSDEALPYDACIDLINRFFETQCRDQQAVPGAVEALARLAGDAQIVILTNVPRHATAARRANMDALGLTYPMAVNGGGKGRAMAWLAAQAGAPCGFIDDSVKQIESVAKHAPEVTRLHFAWAPFIARLYDGCEHATRQVHDWAEAEAVFRDRVLRG